ncbi:meteorin-like protein isoform X1 [Polypterus senegalus]|uniref:meteorin-like protein isoform X1 n=2 Tax=Polypterus senegalus TaxID=55291 RepID=UPI0019646CBA|nr:meteorin-like protein isoform X1 [Polypterus senegalus]
MCHVRCVIAAAPVPMTVWVVALAFCAQLLWSHCAADHCNWRGSGLIREPHSHAVEQVHLRCTEGSVEWMYPTQAIRIALEPNLSTSRPATVCIKPYRNSRGANIYIERAGKLELLVNEEASWLGQVYCFSVERPQQAAVFLQASPQQDISRRTVGFQYELLSSGTPAPTLVKDAMLEEVCRPCNNTELLMAICSSDFVARGFIRRVSHHIGQQLSEVSVAAEHLYRQKSGVFQQQAASGEWQGSLKTLLQCQVRKGNGLFLFTGMEHFGEAWLGCAPRYKDFVRVYQAARAKRKNLCEFPLD